MLKGVKQDLALLDIRARHELLMASNVRYGKVLKDKLNTLDNEGFLDTLSDFASSGFKAVRELFISDNKAIDDAIEDGITVNKDIVKEVKNRDINCLNKQLLVKPRGFNLPLKEGFNVLSKSLHGMLPKVIKELDELDTYVAKFMSIEDIRNTFIKNNSDEKRVKILNTRLKDGLCKLLMNNNVSNDAKFSVLYGSIENVEETYKAARETSNYIDIARLKKMSININGAVKKIDALIEVSSDNSLDKTTKVAMKNFGNYLLEVGSLVTNYTTLVMLTKHLVESLDQHAKAFKTCEKEK